MAKHRAVCPAVLLEGSPIEAEACTCGASVLFPAAASDTRLAGDKLWDEGMWRQAAGELEGLASHLERRGMTITAMQLRMAIDRANAARPPSADHNATRPPLMRVPDPK